MNQAVFEKRLFRLMKQNQDDEKRRKTRTGLIDSSRIARYKVTNRIFKKRNQEKLGKNYFISILMDASGSMIKNVYDNNDLIIGNRANLCLKAVIKLCNSLDKVSGMHFEVVGFNVLEIKYKDYNDKYDSKIISEMYNKQLGDRTERYSTIIDEKDDISCVPTKSKINTKNKWQAYSFAAHNHDGIAVYNSYKRMEERTGRKILVVFSDGKPTWEGKLVVHIDLAKTLFGSKELLDIFKINKSSSAFLKEITKKCMKIKDIDLLGVGIETDAVKMFYPNNIVVNDVDELYSKVIKALSVLFKKD